MILLTIGSWWILYCKASLNLHFLSSTVCTYTATFTSGDCFLMLNIFLYGILIAANSTLAQLEDSQCNWETNSASSKFFRISSNWKYIFFSIKRKTSIWSVKATKCFSVGNFVMIQRRKQTFVHSFKQTFMNFFSMREREIRGWYQSCGISEGNILKDPKRGSSITLILIVSVGAAQSRWSVI